MDFSHENEADISISSHQTSIYEIWGEYPFKPQCQKQWDQKIKNISLQIADLNPYLKFKKPGDEILAVEAVNWNFSQEQMDFRPKIYNNLSKSYILCDTGAMISCVPKENSDKLNPKTKLKTQFYSFWPC